MSGDDDGEVSASESLMKVNAVETMTWERRHM
jgi:hypothetical protein